MSAAASRWLGAGLLALATAGALAQATAVPPAAPAAAQASGRALFHGERAFARPATVAGAALPADAVACARCHGNGAAGAQGGREAGVAVPWLAPALAAGEAGAQRLVQALQQGRSVSGRPLAPPMPHYDLTPDEQAALAAYLAVLGTDAEPVRGVEPEVLHLGVLLSTDPARAAAARAAVQGLGEPLAALNRAGGLYGRQLRLHTFELPVALAPDAADWVAALDAALSRQPVLALVGSWPGELSPVQWQALRARRLPLLASLGPALAEPGAAPGWASSLLPSVQAQLVDSLAEFEQRCGAQAGPLQLALAPVPGLRAVVQAALPAPAIELSVPANAWPADAAPRVLALLPGPELAALRARLPVRACLWTLAMFSGSAGPAHPRELLTLPAQAALPLPGGDAQALWQSLGRLAGQLTVELLAQAGRRLQPEALVQAQLTLGHFEPAPGVALQLNRQRRHALPVMASWRNAHEAR